MSYADNYLTRNDRSKEWASRDGEIWGPEEDATLLERWPSRHREEDVAVALGRTIAACRRRYHLLAGEHPGGGRPRTVDVVVTVCTGCWTALPTRGVCDYCGEGD